jgi:glycosyltransferase involved in cell wall biosynthesis
VHVTNTASSITGVETQLLCLAASQRDRNFSPLVVTDRPGFLADACAARGIPVTIEPGLTLGEADLWPPPEKPVKSLASVFSDCQPDVIHCHSKAAAVLAFSAGERLGVPRVFTYHSAPDDLPRGMAEILGAKFAIISVSRIGLDYLKAQGAPGDSLHYVPCGTEPVSPDRPAVREPHRPNLLLVGVMEDSKGVDVAVLAMRELKRRRGRDCPVLNIYGTGSKEPYLREMTAILGMDDTVRFHGSQPGILRRCLQTDVLIVSSRAEAGPVAVLEAMSRGMPIVASDVGGVAEMLHDPRYGKVIPAESVVALADAVDAMLADISAGRFDPDRLIARHRSLYTAAKMAERTERVYESSLLRHRARAAARQAGPPRSS